MTELRGQGIGLFDAAGGDTSEVRGVEARNVGPETDSAATTVPAERCTGAATATSPGSSSSTVAAQPRRRTSARSASSAERVVIVLGVRRSRRPGGSSALLNATSTLPSAVQWSGTGRPIQFAPPRR